MFNFSEFFVFQGITPAMIVYPLTVGVIIAIIVVYLSKKSTSPFIKKLLDGESNSVETSKTLEELGIQNPLIKLSLMRSTFKSIVSSCTKEERAGGESPTKEERAKKKATELCYYIEDGKKDKATALFLTGKANLLHTILLIVALIIIAVVLVNFIPWIVNLTQQTIEVK